MTITPDLLQTMAAKIASQPLSESVVAAMRQDYPGIHFTYCLEDDIPNHEPLLSFDHFNLYLVDGRQHCLCLTHNYDNATGIVIAEVIPD